MRQRFLGTYEPRLDDKGRLFLPARFREALSTGVVVTRGQEHCLYVFPQTRFDELADGMNTSPFGPAAQRDLSRIFFAGASDEIPDRQGRITIPPALRTYAQLQKECVVIGSNDHVEIWAKELWEADLAAREERYARHEEVAPQP